MFLVRLLSVFVTTLVLGLAACALAADPPPSGASSPPPGQSTPAAGNAGTPAAPTPTPGTTATPAPASQLVRLEIAQGTTARYLVREQLAGANLPNDAVGATSAVTGQLVLGPGNTIVSDQSRFTVDLSGLRSDESRRDNYLRRTSLETARFPKAEFVVKEVRGLPASLPPQGAAQFQVAGDMTIHGVTSSLVWQVNGAFTPEGVTGKATTSFPFSQFGLRIPSVFVVVSVEDNIRLELDFRLVRGG